MTPFGLRFDGTIFAKELMASRARRWMKEKIFDPLGQENLVFLIQNNRSLIAAIPPEVFAELRAAFRQRSSTDQDIYAWLPADVRAIIENQPNGQAWASAEIKALRQAVL